MSSDLEYWLELSLHCKPVPKESLPSELVLNSVHAQLERVIRENRVFTITEKKHDDGASYNTR